MRSLFASCAVVTLVLATSACASSTDRTESVGRSQAAVINGVVDTPEKFPSTVLIQTLIDPKTGEAAGCTGTIITPHLVTTARHCVSVYNEGSGTFGADYDPNNMYIWYGSEPRGTEDNHVARIVHPDGTSIQNNDIALLVLKNAATKPFAQIRLASAPKKGENVAVAGYGLTTSDTGTGGISLHKRYRRESLQIVAVGPMPMYGIGDKEIVLGESICQGDSGGPVYDGATTALLAITSRGGNGTSPTATQPWAGCTGSNAYNWFTRVDGFADLINSTAASLGEKVWEEGTEKPVPPSMPMPDPGALGAVCASPTECASKLCIDYDGKKICSQTCDDANPCPSGYDCNGGYCVTAAATTPTDPAADPGTITNSADPGTAAKAKTCAVSDVGVGDSGLALSFLAILGLAAARRRNQA